MRCTILVMESESRPVLRIGEVGRRVGVSTHLLRAWERRYGLLQPQRAAGGYRLYSAADEARVRRMLAHQAAGLSAAEAARAALEEEPATGPGLLELGDEERLARHEGLAERA